MQTLITALLLLPTLLLAQEEGPPVAKQQGMQTFLMIGIALVFFYFILWRPEQKRRKALETQRAQLKQGDRVSAMGILGDVLRIEEHTVILKMYDGSKIEVVKGAITEVLPAKEKGAKTNPSEANAP